MSYIWLKINLFCIPELRAGPACKICFASLNFVPDRAGPVCRGSSPDTTVLLGWASTGTTKSGRAVLRPGQITRPWAGPLGLGPCIWPSIPVSLSAAPAACPVTR